MEVIYVNNSNRDTHISNSEPCVIALGFFDGLHLGHQQVIKIAKRVAEEKKVLLGCMSFFPHPKEVLQKGSKKFQYLMPIAEKQKILKEMGVEKFYIVEFERDFASLSPEQFVHKYLLDFGVKNVVAGFDFRYGSDGRGHMDRMKDDSNGLLGAIKVGKVEFQGEKISSTLIRRTILSGKMEIIPRYLGSHYQIEGEVSLNKTTAEIKVKPHFLLPAPGVYEVIISNGKETWEQVVVVAKEQMKFSRSPMTNSLLMDKQTVRIEWVKSLQSGFLTSLVNRQILEGASRS
ncbi:hypothetical protein CVD25_22645 [Bacillus canaveralius]|uniref:FAD synthase n=1 Tax=Bacillus canaveralius TaxID=1403243 RepID=A0A2N5GGR2_9BACI|nr:MULTISPECIES: adenylyltransferase/cytidyltransferase family protein [Bacillus]PLR79933.1 hypothetical protein CU635_20475 [Bacillus canaveralius]PLR83505.1 hypothetical protein CVD23_14200 [Bacillus sp. V33-4]PLR88442.1 hypothetical protein CVD25_22645 [Bacillus canaveralius]RSK58168.1 hypothetical protein EJA13_00140 [Bacillus canaveralius]